MSKPTFLCFDTETTGLPVKGVKGQPPVAADDPRQPHVLSFGSITLDENGVELSREKFYVKPEGFTVAECDARNIAAGGKAASEFNGLFDDYLNENGVPIAEVLDHYSTAIRSGLIATAFNVIFDAKMMRGELRRAGLPDLFEETKTICTMRGLAPYGPEGLPIVRGFIKLQLVADHFGFELDNHEVMSDTEAVAHIMRVLLRDGRVPDPKVNYSKHGAPKKAAASSAPLSKPVTSTQMPDKF